MGSNDKLFKRKAGIYMMQIIAMIFLCLDVVAIFNAYRKKDIYTEVLLAVGALMLFTSLLHY